jgi:heat shock protein HtpX
MTVMGTTRTRFRPDRGLSLRMVATMLLLALVYAAFVTALVLLVRSTVLVLLVAGGLLAAQYWFSDRIALVAMRAVVVTPEQEPLLHGVVDRLCALADMPRPQVAVADTDLPNAFATGRSSRRAVLCVTSGMVRRLDTEELEGVLAHELSHVAHRDVAVMTVASFLGVVAGLLVRGSFYAGAFGGRGRRDQSAALAAAAVMGVSALVWLMSLLLTRLLSRYRELAADRAGAILTGRPSTLASALVKVAGDAAVLPTRDLRTAEPFNALLLVPVAAARRGLAAQVSAVLSTHPPLQQRLDQLAELAAEL